MRALTIAELERESAVPRRTIYYYVRIGLLPAAQKASPSRALYTEEHLALLREIEALRGEGLRPAAIRSRIAGRLEAAAANDLDLVARREEETRQAILVAATRSFATKGYGGTRMADLVAVLGITPQLLYSHFATKRDLFVACYKVAVQVMAGEVLPRVPPEGDPAVRLVWYMYADEGIKAFAPDMFALAVEAAHHDEEARRDLREAYETIFRETIADLRRVRASDEEPPLSDELVSHVVMMLEVSGYDVHDLGIDVPVESFVAAIREHEPKVVGLSGLLTLAFDSMKDTVQGIAAAGLRDRVKIMIGGSPVDRQVQDHTSADGWGRDAAAALKMAAAWTGGSA